MRSCPNRPGGTMFEHSSGRMEAVRGPPRGSAASSCASASSRRSRTARHTKESRTASAPCSRHGAALSQAEIFSTSRKKSEARSVFATAYRGACPWYSSGASRAARARCAAVGVIRAGTSGSAAAAPRSRQVPPNPEGLRPGRARKFVRIAARHQGAGTAHDWSTGSDGR